jgi:ubiquinone/menaquinone biosynthesis C-methylase UbiE
MGFRRIIGVDYSAALVLAQDCPGIRIIGDVRKLPLGSGSVDVAVVQGGLHHLFTTADVDEALAEMCRVVSPTGRIVIIEPWSTPFLRLVHFVCERRIARRLSPRIDALATMIEEERETYERWLNAPHEHLAVIRRHVTPRVLKCRLGKLIIVGSPAAL